MSEDSVEIGLASDGSSLASMALPVNGSALVSSSAWKPFAVLSDVERRLAIVEDALDRFISPAYRVPEDGRTYSAEPVRDSDYIQLDDDDASALRAKLVKAEATIDAMRKELEYMRKNYDLNVTASKVGMATITPDYCKVGAEASPHWASSLGCNTVEEQRLIDKLVEATGGGWK